MGWRTWLRKNRVPVIVAIIIILIISIILEVFIFVVIGITVISTVIVGVILVQKRKSSVSYVGRVLDEIQEGNCDRIPSYFQGSKLSNLYKSELYKIDLNLVPSDAATEYNLLLNKYFTDLYKILYPLVCYNKRNILKSFKSYGKKIQGILKARSKESTITLTARQVIRENIKEFDDAHFPVIDRQLLELL